MTEQQMPEQIINRVLLSGRLARDPELFELSNGEPVCVLRLACETGRVFWAARAAARWAISM